MSFIVIDDTDKRPPYEQIVSSIKLMISDRTLAPGDRLAPIRQLSGDLGVAPNTVARAYRDLENEGLVISQGRRGTVVASTANDIATTGVIDQLCASVDSARRAGLSKREVLALVTSHIGA